jgi:hypothetical protein
VNEFESRLMEVLLRGDHPVLAVLRAQLEGASVSKREFTGVGFFTTFAVPLTAPRLAVRHPGHLGRDVYADVPGVENGAGFVLFLKDGALDFLEGFTYGEEQFPAEPKNVRLHYLRPGHPGSAELAETAARDLGYALGELA